MSSQCSNTNSILKGFPWPIFVFEGRWFGSGWLRFPCQNQLGTLTPRTTLDVISWSCSDSLEIILIGEDNRFDLHPSTDIWGYCNRLVFMVVGREQVRGFCSLWDLSGVAISQRSRVWPLQIHAEIKQGVCYSNLARSGSLWKRSEPRDIWEHGGSRGENVFGRRSGLGNGWVFSEEERLRE